ncbi:sensor histidine kinase [Amycolatopsis alkalitolerans]|uniref:histidine kinase n=1 Tax=Amycolatopsis alkalitolerans TaxID=2547244 RepID=A0A5C4LS48_9PSEU|nr:HAMP domain-containing sensor histidine kinase [Amycolatopsis alkalitolerans]TNC21082.1 HAMP domain-containing histidine kinase [Amycolatopsis alkalitolerans]
MGDRRRLVDRIIRARVPRHTVRLRLTLFYGALFIVSGAALLVITYLLVVHATNGVIFTGQHSSVVVETGHGSAAPATPLAQPHGPGAQPPNNAPQVSPQQAAQLALQQHSAELHQLLLQSGIALAIMTVVSIGLGWIVAGRVLRPLRTITAAVRDISATSLHRRLALSGPRDELTELGETFDGLLARLEASFQAQRRFIANASHELRTPLARQRALAQVALADPDATAESLRTVHHRILAAGAQQERLIDALLTLARGQAGIDRHDHIDLADLARQALATRAAEATTRDIDLRATLRPAPTSGDPRLVERVITNLIDNALQHNRPAGHLNVDTDSRDGHAMVTVSNTGPRIPADAIDRLFQPFQHLGTDRVGDRLGLGLSIVQAIASAHHAMITAQPRADGGLTVTVSFPDPIGQVGSNHGSTTRTQPDEAHSRSSSR